MSYKIKTDVMRSLAFIRTISIPCLMLLLCSCQSTSGVLREPFAAPPEHRNAEGPAEALLWPPECKPEYQSESEARSEKTRLVQAEPKTGDNVIRQVAFVWESGESPSAGTSPGRPGLHDISIDPTLSEQGAQIVAEHREGKEEFQGAWRPPGRAGFWPQIEYLADGGDRGAQVYVEEDWSVHHLQTEDTVAHFDTLDGRTLVEPSNRVHLYAPRFGSVRKIEGVLNSGQITALSSTNNQLALNVDQARERLGYTAQESKTGYARTRNQLSGVGSRKASTGVGTTRGLLACDGFESAMLYSNRLRQRAIGSAELAYLAEGSAGARAWQGAEGIRVRIDTLAPMAATSEEGAESFFQIEEDESKSSKLRLIKVASKKAAQPGEIVEFTLRFDNVGNQPIGNVTILDSLTMRLEFVPGSAKSSVPSGFVVQPGESGSFTLRFEITDPLLPGEFGVVQFQCRVR